MTLRLALVIDGDPAGAKKALSETAIAVEDLGNKAETAGKKVEASFKGFEWESGEATRARLGLKEIADEGDRAASGIRAAGEAGQTATPDIAKAGDAAGMAREKFEGLSSVVIGAAGGLAASVAITAVSEGLGVAAGAAAELFREITSNQPMIERALTSHADLVGRIKHAWAEAGGAASSYGVDSIAQLRFEGQQNVSRLNRSAEAAQRDLIRGSDGLRPSDVLGAPFARFGPFRDQVSAFRKELKDGTADVIAFRREVAEIAEALPSDSPFRGLAEQILEDTTAAAQLQAELERSRDLLDGLKGSADAAATALGGKSEKYGTLADRAATAGGAVTHSNQAIGATAGAATQAIAPLSEYSRLLGAIGGAGTLRPFNAVRAATTPPFAENDFAEGDFARVGFAGGGHTGYGPESQIAGFVHGQEYVFDAEATRRIGVSNLDAIRQGVKGYAAGGYVGGSVPAVRSGGSIVTATAEDFAVLRGSLRQFLSELNTNGDALAALGSVIKSVSDRFVDFAFQALDNMIFTGSASGGGMGGILGFLGSAFGATDPWAGLRVPTAHQGAMVGPAMVPTRTVPLSVFASAPRLHTGGTVGQGGNLFAPGERPVIAMDGEEIGWPDQLAAKYGGGSTVNNFYIETASPRAFAESKATVARGAGRFLGRAGRHM
ncbi:hypothetical protein HPDFL43_14922 [Hoeflea phototrophica DFL-43]|uniref:Phage tail tape measure protein, lambda family n=1 Tax=Hoeflea phototrophica (strain DSM 17068 / NCIMB 14078 / DFL-43) TaxID=411684 RepID=A9D2Z0_HOEPD|nr:hypothetical protein [Hoeflea phototrophica]EDQ34300.1 hypothetical protein HPDFL43_14922 [Hoeflea phototrophica DFL-43]